MKAKNLLVFLVGILIVPALASAQLEPLTLKPLTIQPIVPRYQVAPIGGYSIYSQRGAYLGNTGSRYDANSVNNPYGRYGSRYSPESINNPYGQYGSRYSSESARNRYSTSPPVIVGQDFQPIAPVTANPYASTPTRTTLRQGIVDSYRANPSAFLREFRSLPMDQQRAILKLLKE